MKLVYLAGKLSDKNNTSRNPSQVVCDYLKNVHDLSIVAGILTKLGYVVYCPANDLVSGIINGNYNEDDYRNLGYEILRRSDIMVIISESYGVEKEKEIARSCDIPIVKITDIINTIRGYVNDNKKQED